MPDSEDTEKTRPFANRNFMSKLLPDKKFQKIQIPSIESKNKSSMWFIQKQKIM